MEGFPVGWWIALAIQAAVFIAMLVVRGKIDDEEKDL